MLDNFLDFVVVVGFGVVCFLSGAYVAISLGWSF
jgi:hypothetical protein